MLYICKYCAAEFRRVSKIYIPLNAVATKNNIGDVKPT